MQVQKIYLGSRDKVAITCPDCGNSKIVGVPTIQNLFRPIRVKCPCGTSFGVVFEKRNFFRKDVHILGQYSRLDSPDSHEMIVENISRGGLGFKTLVEPGITIGDKLNVRLVLDNQKRPTIRVKVVVRRVAGQHIGAEFLSPDEHTKKELGFYLLT